MYLSAIVVAAGKGKRFKHKVSKAVLKLGSHPVVTYALTVLNRHPLVKEIVLVANRANAEALGSIVKKYKFGKVRRIVLGGRERQDSVSKGLAAIDPRAEFVLIHDAARPFITKGLVSSVVRGAQKDLAAIPGVPVKATIKQSKGFLVEKTLDRQSLWEIQTPQVFKKGLLLKAYRRFGRSRVTDEAMLVEKLGVKVRLVPGAYNNIKITTAEDLLIAKGFAKTWKPT